VSVAGPYNDDAEEFGLWIFEIPEAICLVCAGQMLAPGSTAPNISMDYLLSQMGRSWKSFIGIFIFVLIGSVKTLATLCLLRSVLDSATYLVPVCVPLIYWLI
jgi:hypothetical protein